MPNNKLSAIALVIVGAVALFIHVIGLGATLIPVTSSGVLAEGPAHLYGERPQESYTRDPMGTLTGDLADEIIARNAVSSGQIGFWTPNIGLGHPLSADLSSKTFYPFHLLHFIIPSSYWDFISLAHIVLAAVFVSLFALAAGLPPAGAAISGLSWFSMGHVLLYLPASSVTQAETWVIGLFYLTEATLNRRQPRFTLLMAAFFTYCLATAGHPAPALFGALALTIYVLVRLGLEKSFVPALIGIVVAMACGAMIAAPTWLVFLDLIRSDDVARNTVYPLRYSLFDLPALIFPYAFGAINTALQYGTNGWGIGFAVPPVAFLAMLGTLKTQRSYNSPRLIALAVLSIALVLWGFEIPGFESVHSLPLVGRLNANYLWFIPSFALCIFAGYGSVMLLEADRRTWTTGLTIWIGVLVLFLGLAAFVYSGHTALSASSFGETTWQRGLWPSLQWAGLVPLLLFGLWQLSRPASLAPILWALMAGAVLLSTAGFLPSGTQSNAIMAQTIAMNTFVSFAIVLTLGQAMLSAPHFRLVSIVSPFFAVVIAVSLGWFLAPGVPKRQDAFATAPYIDWLKSNASARSARVYGVGGTLFPNIGAVFGLSAINALATATPSWNGAYFQNFLDEEQNPVQFNGLAISGSSDAAAKVKKILKNRRYWDDAAIKYIAIQGGFGGHMELSSNWSSIDEAERPKAEGDKPQNFVPVSFNHPITLEHACPGRGSLRLGLKLSTYIRSNPGNLTVAWRDDAGVEVRSESQTASLRDNAIFVTPVVSGLCASGTGTLSIAVSFQPTAENSMLAFWQDSGDKAPLAFLMTKGQNHLDLVYADAETGVEVYENSTAGSRAYATGNWEDVPNWQTAQSRYAQSANLRETAFIERPANTNCAVSTKAPAHVAIEKLSLSNNTVDILLEASQPSVLVLADLWMPGWSATVDGQDTPVFRVNGIFRGLCLPDRRGPLNVVFRYRPPLFNTALLIAFAGLVGLSTTLAVARWQHNRTENQPDND